MKLYIRRMQAEKKGLLGGHKGVAFKLYARIELPDEDKAIIEKYKLGDYAAAKYKTPNKGQSASYPEPFIEHRVTTDMLLKGTETYELSDVRELLELEENLKGGCRGMKELISSLFRALLV